MSFSKLLQLPILLILMILSLTHANSAKAWGHLDFLNQNWGNANLIHRVLDSNQINYCIQISDSRFDPISIDTQVRMALQLWLQPLESLGISNVTLAPTSCSSGIFDLKIELGPETVYTTLGSYQLPQRDQNHYYSLVKFNTSYIYQEPATGTQYSKSDFLTLVPSGETLSDFLVNISIKNPLTPQTLAKQLGLSYFTVYEASYRSFLHEFGHSFGLCDLYSTQIHTHCDPIHMSVGMDQVQPAALMNNSNFFYLTPDDISGIQSLAIRFRKQN